MTESRRRVDSVDLLRGVIMVLMALDHTRDYFGAASANPTNLAATTVALFFTRWVTHFCAPVFFLLTGLGAYLSRTRLSTRTLSWFLLTRGLWLVVLEVMVLRFIMQFNVDYDVTLLTVLWAIGWSMVALSGLVFLSPGTVGGAGAAVILLHNLFDGVRATTFGSLAPVWIILHAPGVVYARPGHIVFVAYPLVPWVGVTAVGYAMGPIFSADPSRRRRILLRAGLVVTAAFVLLRALNIYGDPQPWKAQATPVFTWLSFLNTNKYPPSLLFLLMTLGPALLFLRAVDARTPRVLLPALTIGRVPLFYFLLHFLFLHLLTVGVSFVRYHETHWMFESPSLDRYPITQPPGWPASLPVVYLVWVTVAIGMYPLCRWYAAFKARHGSRWLSYL